MTIGRVDHRAIWRSETPKNQNPPRRHGDRRAVPDEHENTFVMVAPPACPSSRKTRALGTPTGSAPIFTPASQNRACRGPRAYGSADVARRQLTQPLSLAPRCGTRERTGLPLYRALRRWSMEGDRFSWLPDAFSERGTDTRGKEKQDGRVGSQDRLRLLRVLCHGQIGPSCRAR